jgi:large subunit ribosomal protein L33
LAAERRARATMAKKGEKREIIRLVCTEDGKNYYTTTKNKVNTQERLELKKFNPNLRRMTVHREKK